MRRLLEEGACFNVETHRGNAYWRAAPEIRYIHTALSVSHYIRGGRKGRGCFNLCAYYTYMNRHLVKYWNYNALDVIPWLFQSLI